MKHLKKMAIFFLSRHLDVGDIEKRNASSKAIVDIETMLFHLKSIPIDIYEKNGKHGVLSPFQNALLYYNALNNTELKNGDVLVVQMPMEPHTLFLSLVFKKLIKSGIKIIVLIHDINHVRLESAYMKKCRMKIEELSIYRQADALIVHNENMEKLLINKGIDIHKIVKLNLFDYLTDVSPSYHCNKDSGVVVAGNLSPNKSGYIYKLKGTTQFLLYGPNYVEAIENRNVCYMGSFMPNELIEVIKGAFGLVWDGNSTDYCDGNYGRYLKINNPHKTSLYLACGMPVIIWEQAALASFIVKNKVGITVSNLNEIDKVLYNMTDSEYIRMKENALQLSKKIRTGYFFLTAFSRCMEIIDG